MPFDTDPPDLIRQNIAAMRANVVRQRAEAELILKRARAEEERADFMEKRLAERLGGEFYLKHIARKDAAG